MSNSQVVLASSCKYLISIHSEMNDHTNVFDAFHGELMKSFPLGQPDGVIFHSYSSLEPANSTSIFGCKAEWFT